MIIPATQSLTSRQRDNKGDNSRALRARTYGKAPSFASSGGKAVWGRVCTCRHPTKAMSHAGISRPSLEFSSHGSVAHTGRMGAHFVARQLARDADDGRSARARNRRKAPSPLNDRQRHCSVASKRLATRRDPSVRHEAGGFIYRNPETGELFFQEIFSTATAGSYVVTGADTPQPPPQSWIVAMVHIYPFNPITDSIPEGVCPKQKGHGWGHPGFGPSPADDSTAATMGLPSYIVDSLNVYRTLGPNQHWQTKRIHGSCNVFPPKPLLRINPPKRGTRGRP